MYDDMKMVDVARVLAVCAAVMGFTVHAPGVQAQEQPSLQQLLGRAQSQSERKAVEDLIDRLKGPHPSADAPAKQQATPKTPERAQDAKPVQASEGDKSAAAPQPDSGTSRSEESAAPAREQAVSTEPSRPVPVETTKSEAEDPASKPATTALSPDAAVQQAERRQLPSVDLEVQFEFDSAQMTPAAIEVLTPLGHALSDARLADGQFLIAGHTDGKGKASYNVILSQRRAEAVRQFLITNFNLDGARLVAKGFGERHLKNAQQPRAAENRRVQIVNMASAAASR
jgi:outer membrane protein OmpA-like peptidoglycan-associated protein